MEHWDLVAAERRALADLLDTLSDEQWATLTLCEAWTVKDMAAHVMVGPTFSYFELAGAMVMARLKLDRALERMTATRARHTREELLATIREHAESRFSPPTLDWHAPLTEIMVHREDIVVPLGLASDRPVETWRHVLDFLASDQARRAFLKAHLPGVRFVATRPGVGARPGTRGERIGRRPGHRAHGPGGCPRPSLRARAGDLLGVGARLTCGNKDATMWVGPSRLATQLKRG